MPVLLGEFAARGIGRPAAGRDMDMLSQPQRVIAAFLTRTGEIVRPNGVVSVKIKVSEFHIAFLVCNCLYPYQIGTLRSTIVLGSPRRQNTWYDTSERRLGKRRTKREMMDHAKTH